MASKFCLLAAIPILFLGMLKSSSAGKCFVNIKTDIPKKYPPIVLNLPKLASQLPSYVYPKDDEPSNLIFEEGEQLEIFCPKEIYKNTVKDNVKILINNEILEYSSNPETIECIGDDKFKLPENEIVAFKEISCQHIKFKSNTAIIKKLEKDCFKGDRYEIGFKIDEDLFLKIIDLCHNKDEAKTVWAHSVIISVKQEDNKYTGLDKKFKTGSLYKNLTMRNNGPYDINRTFETLSNLLNGTDAAMKYLSPIKSDYKYLVEGQLIAQDDLFYKSEQESTYFYANAVPIWKNVRDGNWLNIEKYVHKLVFDKKHELDIYVGGLGVLELDSKEFYLYREQLTNKGKIPVPKVLFKCVVNKADKEENLCFLVVNNPYVENIQEIADKYNVCNTNPICEQLFVNHDDFSLGYLYCCSLKDFYLKNVDEVGLDDMKQYIDFKTTEQSSADECRVNTKTGIDKKYPPMVIKLTNPPSYVYPKMTESPFLVLANGENVTIFCPEEIYDNKSSKWRNSGVILANDEQLEPSLNLANITCIGDNRFKFPTGTIVTFDQIRCLKQLHNSRSLDMKNLDKKCLKGDRYEIGYNIDKHRFLKNIDICYNKEQAKPLWVHSVIVSVINDVGRIPAYFRVDRLDNAHMYYTRIKAFKTLSSLLNSTDAAMAYLSTGETGSKYLARGHLIAHADMFYKSEQDSTYLYANVVPMWQKINGPGGNWYQLEEHVRFLAFHKKHDLDEYAGGIGVLELDGKEFYLRRESKKGKEEKKIPVPKVLFKCIVDKTEKEKIKGVCLLVVNNPYIKSIDEIKETSNEYMLCENIIECQQLFVNHADFSSGYLYCCTLKDFYFKNVGKLGLDDLEEYIVKDMELPSKRSCKKRNKKK